MVAVCAVVSVARCGSINQSVATRSSAKSSCRSFVSGAPVVSAAATRRRRASVLSQAVVTPPQTHDNARPNTTLRPVSAAAVDSSKALEQFRSMGGASRAYSPYLFLREAGTGGVTPSVGACALAIRVPRRGLCPISTN